MPENNDKKFDADKMNQETGAVNYFLGLKNQYETQRKGLEDPWRQANSAVHMDGKLDKIYDGRAQIQSPIMKWKVRGIQSRMAKILFNISPLGRLEPVEENDPKEPFVNLMNDYIFEYQINEIGFKEEFKKFLKNKIIYGTSVAKVTQEFDQKDIEFQDGISKTVITKDNTFFRNLLLTEFYTDVNKMDINESQACIHSTTISMEEIRKNERRKVTRVFQLEDENGNVIGEEEETTEEGFYHNVSLIEPTGGDFTVEQKEYIEWLGLNAVETNTFKDALLTTRNTGFVDVDECYGRFIIDGEEKEVVCTIANGRVVIRLEETPFRHEKYIRPFVVGRYDEVPNSFYGQSNVIAGQNLLKELNATRAQAVDAKTRSISNMWYEDTSKQLRWDRKWTPNGIVKGEGQKGLVPLLNPYLGNISISDTQLIQRDIDQLWSLSPVQEGTADPRYIPSTRGGTLAIIAQNDMPLNDLIDMTIENEIKHFIEMLYERNLTFKTFSEIAERVGNVEMKALAEQVQGNPELGTQLMQQMMFDFDVKILGGMELSNEIAQQSGWISFGQIAQQIPDLVERINWQEYGDKLLRSFGIKDDAEGVFYSDEEFAQIQQQKQQTQEQNVQQQVEIDQARRQASRQDYEHKVTVDTQGELRQIEAKAEADIVEKQAEATIETTFGVKV